MLQDIIQKQKAHMEIQERTGRLLLAQAERMGKDDNSMAQAVDQFQGTFTPALTAEEEQLVEDAGADFIATSRFSSDAGERETAGRRLRGFKNDQTRVAGRLFAKKDFHAARGIFEMVIEEDPGAWDAMINLGIVQLNLNAPEYAAEQFRQAILVAGERKSPYAHLMLGVAYKSTELYDEAEQELRTTVKLDPNNAKAHILLGNIAGSQGRLEEAELSFKQAIEINGAMWEPHRNLARVHLMRKNKKEAFLNYRTALKLGAPPDLELERLLGKEKSTQP